MAQRKKKFTKKKRHVGHKDPEVDSDLELATEIKDDDTVRS